MLGQLDDKGNTETVRNYLDLLAGAGMMSGLQKFDPKQVKSGRVKPTGIVEFCQRYPQARPLVVGSRNLSVERFLMHEVPLFG